MYFSFILYQPNFHTGLCDWKVSLWVCGFLFLELVCVLSEMDVSEEAQAGPVSAEKQPCLSLTSALSSLGIRQCSYTDVPLLCLRS